MTVFGRLTRWLLIMPIALYRVTFSSLVGNHCRHQPTCSDYARQAIWLNGPWRGLWLTLARLLRCHPWGSAGFDPVPDIRQERHPFAPWRYGRWRLSSGHTHASETSASKTSPVLEDRAP